MTTPKKNIQDAKSWRATMLNTLQSIRVIVDDAIDIDKALTSVGSTEQLLMHGRLIAVDTILAEMVKELTEQIGYLSLVGPGRKIQVMNRRKPKP